MMTRAERAKQFMPFDAMKGLRQALQIREERHSRVERHDISEDMQEEISQTIIGLRYGSRLAIECYYDFHDVTKEGFLTGIDKAYKFLQLDEDKIFFKDIYRITVLDP